MTWEPKNKTEDDDDGLMSDDEKEKESGDGSKLPVSSDTFGKLSPNLLRLLTLLPNKLLTPAPNPFCGGLIIFKVVRFIIYMHVFVGSIVL